MILLIAKDFDAVKKSSIMLNLITLLIGNAWKWYYHAFWYIHTFKDFSSRQELHAYLKPDTVYNTYIHMYVITSRLHMNGVNVYAPNI